MSGQNLRVALASRPVGAPKTSDFRIETAELLEPEEGQVALEALWLSLDPYMRGRMNDGPSYAAAVELGEVMTGQTVSRVLQSNLDGFEPGDLVLSMGGWQTHSVSGRKGLMKLPPLERPSYALGVLGMPGFTAYVGLLDIGEAKSGETVVVGAATGAVGSVVGQIAKLKGCRAVGVAGGAEKCQYAVEKIGFDACLDHRGGDLRGALAGACPDGVDVYFESIGGAVLAATLPLMNQNGRIPVCGLVSHYNATSAPEGPDRLPGFLRTVLRKRLKVQGFLIYDHYARRYADFARDMGGWLAAGEMSYREDVVDGLEAAPEAFIGLLEGRNFGKLVVKIAE